MKEDDVWSSITTSDKEPDNSAPAAMTTAGPPFVNFSRKDRLRRAGGKLFGNWQPSFSGGCIYPFSNIYIEEGAIIKLEDAGKCSGGGEMVKATHN